MSSYSSSFPCLWFLFSFASTQFPSPPRTSFLTKIKNVAVMFCFVLNQSSHFVISLQTPLLSNVYLSSVFFCWKNNHPRSSVPPHTIHLTVAQRTGLGSTAPHCGFLRRPLPRAEQVKTNQDSQKEAFVNGKITVYRAPASLQEFCLQWGSSFKMRLRWNSISEESKCPISSSYY